MHFSDVTESVEAEHALAVSERRFEAMVRNSNDFIVVADGSMRTRYLSEAFGRLLGYDPAEFIGLEWGEGIPGEHGRRCGARSAAVVENPARSCGCRSASRTLRWLGVARVGPFEPPRRPRIHGIIGNFRDVTEQRHLIRELETVRRVPVARVLVHTGLFEEDSTNGSDARQRALGRDHRHARGRGPGLRVAQLPAPRGPPEDLGLEMHRERVVRRLRIRRPDGEVRWIDVRSVVLPPDEQGTIKRSAASRTSPSSSMPRRRTNDWSTSSTSPTTSSSSWAGRRADLPERRRSRAFGLDDASYGAARGIGLAAATELGRCSSTRWPSHDPLLDVDRGALVRAPDGSSRPMSMQVLIHSDEQGQFEFFSAVLHDISERKAARVTGSPTRPPTTRSPACPTGRCCSTGSSRRSTGRAARQAGVVAVLFLDLDHFKVVNDSLGHGLGDRLLVAIAERLQTAVRPGDTVARFGGDEFVVLCEDLGRPATTPSRSPSGSTTPSADRSSSTAPRCSSACSIGIAFPDETEADPETLIRDADAAMYQAKERARPAG